MPIELARMPGPHLVLKPSFPACGAFPEKSLKPGIAVTHSLHPIEQPVWARRGVPGCGTTGVPGYPPGLVMP